jgi:hypothetical protein
LETQAEPVQLALLCACGRRPLELRGPGCCRLCYYRRYRSLRFFGGLREVVLKRDRFRCRACGDVARLVVHHRNGHNEKRALITLCIGCHTRVHRYRALGRWVPEVLLRLWTERHPLQPLQLQLHFAVATRAADDEIAHPRVGKGALTGRFLRPRGLLEATAVERVEAQLTLWVVCGHYSAQIDHIKRADGHQRVRDDRRLPSEILLPAHGTPPGRGDGVELAVE